MKQTLSAFLFGLVFGFGLALSTMTDRGRVLGFLDLAGDWDPTLLFVMGGAVLVTVVLFRFVLRCRTPLLASRFFLPDKTALDGPLLIGAAIFGIGWGLAGYCPGPAIAGLHALTINPVLFVVALVAGSLLGGRIQRWPGRRRRPQNG